MSLSLPSALTLAEDTDGVAWLPFSIAHEGAAARAAENMCGEEVSTASATSEGGIISAHFRGRRLKGVTRQLPSGYIGLVLRPSAAGSVADTDERSWAAIATFSRLRVFNHDLLPSANDWQMRCIDWLALASEVHAPVSEAAVQAELAEARTQ